MENDFFKQIFFGNSLQSYCWLVGVILFGVLFKKIVSRFLSKLLFKLFTKLSDEVNVETFIEMSLKPIAFFISVGSFYIAVNQLNYPLEVKIVNYSHLVNGANVRQIFTLGQLIDKLFLFFILLSFFWIILRMVDFVAYVFMRRAAATENRTDDQLVPFLKELFKFIIYFIGFFVLLGYVFEVNALSLITGLGIGGIAIALAAKESLENLIASFTIFIDKPFTMGDLVRVDGVEGVIEKVGFRSTVLRSTDKTTFIIPNRAMIDGVLENLTRRNFRRVVFTIGLIYETDPKVIQNIIQNITSYLDKNKLTTDQHVNFDGFDESALKIQVLYLVENIDFAEYLKVKETVNFKIIEIVKQNEAEFAYPVQRQVIAK